MNKRGLFGILGLSALLLIGAGCNQKQVTEQPVVDLPKNEPAIAQNPTTTPPGGDRDAHGCIPSAGYSWCEPKKECIRSWETPCYPSDEELIKKALADKLQLKPTEIFVNISASTSVFAKGSVGSVGEEDGPAGMFLVSKSKDVWSVDYNGNGQANCSVLKKRGYPEAMLKGVCD